MKSVLKSRFASGASLAMCAAAMLLPATTIAQAVPTAPAKAPAAPRIDLRPNIILILADDYGVEGVNAYGGEYHTPNLDRLAAEGMRFDNAHATPLCSPSRTRLMTGLENHRNYEAFGYLAPGQVTFGNVLKNAGYATGIVGKWQLMGNGFDGRKGITPEQAGFDESYLWQLKALDAKGSRYWGPTRAINGRSRIMEEGFGPDVDNDWALKFIEKHKDRPFFLYYPMVLVHDPFVATPMSMNAERQKDRFSGMTTYMDMLVGRVMAKLKELGLDENTVVMFTGDNGTNVNITSTRDGHAVKGGKGSPVTNGTHVPMIVRAPGRISPGTSTAALFDFEDVLPTFAELAEVPVKAGSIDGVSQMPVLTGRTKAVRDSIFMHYAPVWVFEPARLVFDGRWKLYGDGRFVSTDLVSGVETEMTPATMTAAARKRRAQFQKILDDTKDGPLDLYRFPMCAGKPSRDPAQPAIRAGCEGIGNSEG